MANANMNMEVGVPPTYGPPDEESNRRLVIRGSNRPPDWERPPGPGATPATSAPLPTSAPPASAATAATAAPQGRPPADYLPPDFTRRSDFEQQVYDQLGFNPFLVDPSEEVRKSDENMRDLFNHVFQYQVSWVDRDKLNAEQAAYWSEAVKMHHGQVEKEATDKREYGMKVYEYMMGRFDSVKKEYDEQMKRMSETRQFYDADTGQMEDYAVDPRTGDWVKVKPKEGYKKPPTKDMLDEDGNKRMYQWNESTGEWEQTEHIVAKAEAKEEDAPKPPTPTQIIAINKETDRILGSYRPGEKVSQEDLDMLNRVLESAGLPPMREILTMEDTRGWIKRLLGIGGPSVKHKYEATPEDESGGGGSGGITHEYRPGVGLVPVHRGRIPERPGGTQ